VWTHDISAVVICIVTGAGCGGTIAGGRLLRDAAPPSVAQLAQLWIDPGETPRDLFWGSGGRSLAPDPRAAYTLESRDDTGFSVSYDVTGPDHVEWSAKIGPEAQTEVVVSRILWGLGYHQPPLYYLPSWELDPGRGGTRTETEARFRPKLEYLKPDGYWRWADNPFLGARPFRGLLVVLLMLNSTDLKDDNNSLYELGTPREGASRWFLVRDLGAALGATGKLYPRRNWLEGFERAGFITRVSGDTVEFDYQGRHRELLAMITPADVRWAADRMNRLTDAQWRDAFRAGNYADPIASRYIRRIEQKIADGLSLKASPGVAAGTVPGRRE
jgi:hypothetical protein